MTKEEILKRAQANSDVGMEMENKSMLKMDAISSYIGILMCILIELTKIVLKKELDYGILTVLFSILSMQYISEGKRMSKPVCVVLGVLFALVAVLGCVAFIGGLI